MVPVVIWYEYHTTVFAVSELQSMHLLHTFFFGYASVYKEYND